MVVPVFEPFGTVMVTAPVGVGTLTLPPSTASDSEIGNSSEMSSPAGSFSSSAPTVVQRPAFGAGGDVVEDQLVGAKAGDEREVKVSFPEDYGAAHLAGKQAVFDVKVKAVAAPGELELNDDLAKQMGLESIEKLREIVRGQIESQFGAMTRQKVKRQLLDALDKDYNFPLPEKLVEAEFNNIWSQVSRELEQSGKTFEDEDTTEEKAREDYRKLAERRVRLGLVLSEIGEKAGVTISDEELQRALFEQVRQYPGQEQQVYDYFRKTPEAIQSLRAPIYEEKVVDHLLGSVKVTDKTVSREELMKEDEEEASAAA